METFYCFHGYQCKIPYVVHLPAKCLIISKYIYIHTHTCKAENELKKSIRQLTIFLRFL